MRDRGRLDLLSAMSLGVTCDTNQPRRFGDPSGRDTNQPLRMFFPSGRDTNKPSRVQDATGCATAGDWIS